MTRFLILSLLCILIIPQARSQKVGLVLSGGGAKGLIHIGIIRALEENNIPIDYITGTSMGAIVGSLYAMGYSPDEMEELFRSEEFKLWYSGNIEENYMYYFKQNLPTPEFFNIRLSLDKELLNNNIPTQILPTSFVNPIQMNLVFIQLFASATAASQKDFNNLFVPFRCVASDVFNKRQLILKDGDLGDAVRASMSFPFVFRPIEIDSILAYDGGIYNNFPIDVMCDHFNPDIIIGSVVAKNPAQPEIDNLMSQIENLVVHKTDYSMPDSMGILLRFRPDDVNLLDFHRLDELKEIGYDYTISMMDSIKKRINRRIDAERIRTRRMVYRSNYPELRFKNIHIEGATPLQQVYIKREFHRSDEDVFDYEDVKRAYFRLLSGNAISEIIPHAIYQPDDDTFDLYLKVKVEDRVNVRIGGNLSTTNANQMYFGVSYQDLNYYSKEFVFDGHLGKVYNNAQFMTKIDFATAIPTSYRFIASISSFDYFKGNNLFSSNTKPAFHKKYESFLKLKVAFPFLYSKRAEFGFGVGRLEDSYFQNNLINFDEDKYDRSKYKLLGGSISINGSTLNSRQYATQGYRENLKAQIFTGKEQYRSGVSKENEGGLYDENHSWLQISYFREDFYRITRRFTLGSYSEAFYASRNFSENYTATLLQAGEFAPTPHSQVTYNEAFRANQYFASGLRSIYHLNDLFHLRGELYGFLPIHPIERNSINKAYYGKAFSRFEYLGEMSLVCQFSFGAISAFINHYSSPKKEWNIGLSLGWQLFNYRFIE